MATMEQEAQRVIDVARARGVYLRVIGGLAVKMHCPSAEHRAFTRQYGDLDCVGYRSQRLEIGRALEEAGFLPNRRFNALQGHRRLLYEHPEGLFDVDVFLDVFVMCHELNLAGRLHMDQYTVPLTELLLSKLQIVELNEKDVKDIYAIVHDHDLEPTVAPEVIDTNYIARLCGDDWGWYKTVTLNLDKLLALADEYMIGENKERVVSQLQMVKQIIKEAPKSIKWKMRARIGERKRWYDLPEEVIHASR